MRNNQLADWYFQDMATSSGTAEIKENSVISLQEHPFTKRSLEEKRG